MWRRGHPGSEGGLSVQGFQLFPDQASTLAGRVDELYFFLVAVSGLFSLIIVVFLVYFAARYRRRPGREPVQVEGSLSLEVIWTIIPAVVTMVMFVWGASLFLSQSIPPAGAREILVVGHRWMWKLQHSNGRREINELHVPAGQAIKLTLTSQDVIHSFFVPAFRVKQDAVPGQYRVMWFEATLPGEYHLFCAEYCGTNHSRMTGRVIVMTSQDYQKWLAGSSETSPAEAGRELFTQLECAGCHASGGTMRGPVLGGRFGTMVPLAAGGDVLFDEAYVRQSLMEPLAGISRGFAPVMPSYQGQITEEQILSIIAYLKSLGSDAADSKAGSTQ